MADPRDRDDIPEATQDAGQQSRETSGGPTPIGMGRGYGRDFGAAGRGQGFDGSHGEGYGGGFSVDEQSWMERRAEVNMRGLGPHQGRGPQGWRRSDQRVREDVCERLSEDRLIDARGIEVEVRDGVVTLGGEAYGASDPTRASQIARAVHGVKDVRLELSVKPRAGGSLPRQPGEDEGRTDKSPMGYPILPT